MFPIVMAISYFVMARKSASECTWLDSPASAHGLPHDIHRMIWILLEQKTSGASLASFIGDRHWRYNMRCKGRLLLPCTSAVLQSMCNRYHCLLLKKPCCRRNPGLLSLGGACTKRHAKKNLGAICYDMIEDLRFIARRKCA